MQGNYVTLTNMSDHDIDRIVYYHMEPMNISFQTMNPDLRCKMLHNRFAGEALKKVETEENMTFSRGSSVLGTAFKLQGFEESEKEDFTEEEEQVMLTEIRSGYDRSSDGQCVYCIEFVLDNGKTVRMNGYSNEILSAA